MINGALCLTLLLQACVCFKYADDAYFDPMAVIGAPPLVLPGSSAPAVLGSPYSFNPGIAVLPSELASSIRRIHHHDDSPRFANATYLVAFRHVGNQCFRLKGGPLGAHKVTSASSIAILDDRMTILGHLSLRSSYSSSSSSSSAASAEEGDDKEHKEHVDLEQEDLRLYTHASEPRAIIATSNFVRGGPFRIAALHVSHTAYQARDEPPMVPGARGDSMASESVAESVDPAVDPVAPVAPAAPTSAALPAADAAPRAARLVGTFAPLDRPDVTTATIRGARNLGLWLGGGLATGGELPQLPQLPPLPPLPPLQLRVVHWLREQVDVRSGFHSGPAQTAEAGRGGSLTTTTATMTTAATTTTTTTTTASPALVGLDGLPLHNNANPIELEPEPEPRLAELSTDRPPPTAKTRATGHGRREGDASYAPARMLTVGHVHSNPGETYGAPRRSDQTQQPPPLTKFGHSYVSYFVEFDADPPYAVRAQSPPFCFPSLANASLCETIQFVSSLLLVPRRARHPRRRNGSDAGGSFDDGSNPAVRSISKAPATVPLLVPTEHDVVVAYGINDCESATVRIPLSELLDFTREEGTRARDGKEGGGIGGDSREGRLRPRRRRPRR